MGQGDPGLCRGPGEGIVKRRKIIDGDMGLWLFGLLIGIGIGMAIGGIIAFALARHWMLTA